MLPLSLYIHVPWCIRKCPYCDFNSHKSPDQIPEEDYIQALIRDFKTDLSEFPPRNIESIFIGGGTPSLLSAQAYEKLFNELTRHVNLAPHCEITLEANPGTVEQQRFAAYRHLGINRLSLGIQSFDSAHLKALGRIHDGNQAHQAIITARKAGFDNLNLDLMYALPNQTTNEVLQDLKAAESYQPEHLSWYQLTIEPNTIFHKTRPTLPSEEAIEDFETAGFSFLAEKNFQRYEISAFAQPKKMAMHNLNYWRFGDYLGIGAGAHGKYTHLNQQVIRTRKQRQPKDYLDPNKSFLVERQAITNAELAFEFMLNATRLEESISHALFEERTGLSIDIISPQLQLAFERGFIQRELDSWQVTAFGRQFTNDLQALFLPT